MQGTLELAGSEGSSWASALSGDAECRGQEHY